MGVAVVRTDEGHRLLGDGPITAVANRYLAHLRARSFSPATVRGYAFDLLNLSRFVEERGLSLVDVVPTDFFEWLDWQTKPTTATPAKVVPLGDLRGPAPATINRRVAAVRGLFEYAVITGTRTDNPVPPGRRSTGLRSPRRGMLGHLGSGRPRSKGRLVCQDRRLPESLDPEDVAVFVADLESHRDRAVVLAMVLGGLRAAEVRGLRLDAVDMGLRQLRVVGKGGRERVVPVGRGFFSEVAAYLRSERPPGCSTPECFVVLRGSTAGAAMTEAGMRKIFRTHRARSGQPGSDRIACARPMAPSQFHGRHRPARAGRSHGPCPAGDHRRLRAPLTRDARHRVRPSPADGPRTAVASTRCRMNDRLRACSSVQPASSAACHMTRRETEASIRTGARPARRRPVACPVRR